jgi:hypothetical protein
MTTFFFDKPTFLNLNSNSLEDLEGAWPRSMSECLEKCTPPTYIIDEYGVASDKENLWN